MGDRYVSDVECPYCYTLNKGILFADDWAETMTCSKCGKISKLSFHFVVNASKIKKINTAKIHNPNKSSERKNP